MKTMKLTGFALAAVSMIGLASCSDDDDNNFTPLPPIGGYNSSDEVGAADLIAYWPLNGNGNESKSGIAPSASAGVTWAAGAKGQGATMVNGYMSYPQIAALTQTMNAFTISAWAKLKNNQTAEPGSGSVSTIFSTNRAGDWQGNMMLYAETGQQRPVNDAGVANDSIKVKAGWNTNANGGQIYENFIHLEPWMVDDNILFPGKHVAGPNVIGGTWAQLVFTWDGATHKFIIYSNGVKISSPAFEIRGEDVSSLTMDAASTPIIGAFGNFATTTDAWNKPLTGSVDEIRIWKKALSAADIGALYELERNGR